MTVLKELCISQRKYTNSNGEEKTQWLKIGEIHEKDGREYGVIYPHINLAALPRKEGDDRLFFSLFNPKPKESKGKPQSVDIESDLPF